MSDQETQKDYQEDFEGKETLGPYDSIHAGTFPRQTLIWWGGSEQAQNETTLGNLHMQHTDMCRFEIRVSMAWPTQRMKVNKDT